MENQAKTVSDAIRAHDYTKALELETRFSLNKKIGLERNSLYRLLVILNQLIKGLNYQETTKNVELVKKDNHKI